MGIWALLFNPDKRFEPRAERDAAVESRRLSRGSHGSLRRMPHAAQSLSGAEQPREKFAGAVQAGWRAYNITADPK